MHVPVRRLGLSTLPFLVALSASPSRSPPDDCPEARHDYREAIEALSRDLRAYTACIGQSRGEDDCAVAFTDVESAQKEFEDAVADVRDECRQR